MRRTVARFPRIAPVRPAIARGRVNCLDTSAGQPTTSPPRSTTGPLDRTESPTTARSRHGRLGLHFALPPTGDYCAAIEREVGSSAPCTRWGQGRARITVASKSEASGNSRCTPAGELRGHVNPGARAGYRRGEAGRGGADHGYRTTHGTTSIVEHLQNLRPRMRATTVVRSTSCGGDRRRTPTVAGTAPDPVVCYVDDTVDGVRPLGECLAVRSRGLSGGADRAGDRESSSPPPGPLTHPFVERPTDDPMVRRPDISLISRELGWSPSISWHEGLHRTIAAMAPYATV